MRLSSKSLLLSLCAIAGSLVCHATTPAITVTPGFTLVGLNQTLQYKATVTGLASTAVKWEVASVVGGKSTTGTISATGVYKAPAKLPGGNDEETITAIGSDGKTKGSMLLRVTPDGPVITSVSPNPIAPGKFTITIHGTGFVSGAMVLNGTTGLAVHYVSPTEVTAVGYQATTASGAFKASNPGTAWGNTAVIPFKAVGTAPTISPVSIYVHLGNQQQFTPRGTVTYWTASEGSINQTGDFTAPTTMPASSTVKITGTGPGGPATAVVRLAGGPEPTISPKSVKLQVGQKQQFSSSGATSWSAKYGAITSSGLYTAPATWPATGGDVISILGIHGSASEEITVKLEVATALGVLVTVGKGVNPPHPEEDQTSSKLAQNWLQAIPQLPPTSRCCRPGSPDPTGLGKRHKRWPKSN